LFIAISDALPSKSPDCYKEIDWDKKKIRHMRQHGNRSTEAKSKMFTPNRAASFFWSKKPGACGNRDKKFRCKLAAAITSAPLAACL
jgi:hypothetical protein